MTYQTGVSAGWYPDPAGSDLLRWWDGAAWSPHTAPSAALATRPPAKDDLHWVLPTGRSGLAITAGYLGIVALLCFFTAPVALVVGILALRQLNGSALKGRGRAIFAIVVGALGTAGLLAYLGSGLLH